MIHGPRESAGRGQPLPLAEDQVDDQAGPAGLVGGAEALAGIAVEVLVERQQVVPGGVVLEQCSSPKTGRRPSLVEEDAHQPPRQIVGELGQASPGA